MTVVTLILNGEKATRVYVSSQNEINTLVAGWSKLLNHLHLHNYQIIYTLSSKYEKQQAEKISGDAPRAINSYRAVCLDDFHDNRSNKT